MDRADYVYLSVALLGLTVAVLVQAALLDRLSKDVQFLMVVTDPRETEARP